MTKIRVLGPISLTIVTLKSDSMENSQCCNSIPLPQIVTKFGTFHDDTAVATCANLVTITSSEYLDESKWNSHEIWILIEKLLVKYVLILYEYVSWVVRDCVM